MGVGTLGVAALAAVVGGIGAAKPTLTYALLAALLFGLYAALARVSPRLAIAGMFVGIALIPVYLVPDVQAFSPQPAALLALILAACLTRRDAAEHLTPLDITFALLVIAMGSASLIGPASPFATGSELFLYVAPYLAGRAICSRNGGEVTLATGAALVGVIAVPFVLYEAATQVNVFFQFASDGSRFTDIWARPAYRGTDTLRTQAAFGHPLSMAFIVSSAAVFAVALGVRARRGHRQIGWVLAGVVMMLAQSTSNERSGWLVFGVGLALFAASTLPRRGRVRHLFALALVAVPLAVVALSLSGSQDSETARSRADSAEHRVALYERALEPGAFQVFGSPQSETFNAFVAPVRPGSIAIDSAFLSTGDMYGFIALFALIGVVAATFQAMVRLRGTWAAILPAVAIAGFSALTVVGFQTQIPIFVWLVVGSVAGAQLARRREADTAVQPRLTQ